MKDPHFRSPARIARRLKLLPLVARVVKNWPTFMRHYALGSVPARPYEFRNGARLKIGRGVDHVPIIEIFLRRDYGVPPDDAVIVDLGANIGAFAIYAAVTARNARVYAYEPVVSFYQLMLENVRLNGCGDSITCRNSAVAGEALDRDLYVGGANPFFPSLIAPADDAAATRTALRCTTLEKVLAAPELAQVDLLKIDIEGAEYEVLYRAQECLERVREIRMEYHAVGVPGHDVEDLKRFLTARGFQITHQRATSPTHGNLWAARQ